MVELILEAIEKAKAKHGDFYNTPERGVLAVCEEAGELAQAVLDNESKERQREEAIDTIVSCLRFIERNL